MNRISKLRKDFNLTQEQLAAKLSIPRSTLAMYETERAKPTFSIIASLCDIFNVTAEYLMGLSDSPETYDRVSLSLIPNSITIVNEHKQFAVYVFDAQILDKLAKLIDDEKRISKKTYSYADENVDLRKEEKTVDIVKQDLDFANFDLKEMINELSKQMDEMDSQYQYVKQKLSTQLDKLENNKEKIEELLKASYDQNASNKKE